MDRALAGPRSCRRPADQSSIGPSARNSMIALHRHRLRDGPQLVPGPAGEEHHTVAALFVGFPPADAPVRFRELPRGETSTPRAIWSGASGAAGRRLLEGCLSHTGARGHPCTLGRWTRRRPHDGGRGYAGRQFDLEHSIECRFGTPIAAGDRAVVEWWASWVEDERELTLAGATVLRFDGNGRVVEHVDYWVERDGRLAPFTGWGR